MRTARISMVVVCLCACGGSSAREDTTTPKQAPSKPPLELPEGGTPLQLLQRSSADLPGSGGAFQIGIDDITAGQVALTVGRKDGGAVLVSRSVRAQESVPFTIDGHRYEIVVEALENVAIGDDKARLRVRAVGGGEGSPPSAATRSEPERIEALLAMVASSGIVFVRNGSDHSASEAADHLRTKWSRAGDRITTAEEFIEHLGSTSSTTGEPYKVRLPDGTQRDAGPWLREQLAAIDAK